MTKKTAQSAKNTATAAPTSKPEHYLVTGPEGTNSAYVLATGASEAAAIWAKRTGHPATEATAQVIRPGEPPAVEPAAE